MISPEAAREAAGSELRGAPVRIDPNFAVFAQASLGEPVVVHNVAKQPSYWLFPVELAGKVVGFVRVSATGQATTVGSFCHDLSQLPRCPEVVTRISANEASRLAASWLDDSADETPSPPVYVHDGPPGREAWLVETLAGGRPARWIFVTPAGAYDRPAAPAAGEETAETRA